MTTKPKLPRGDKGRFLPGGPGRLPGYQNRKAQEIQEACRLLSGKAVKRLADIMMERKNPKASIMAAQTILAYAYGKPQMLADGDGGGIINIRELLVQIAVDNRRIPSDGPSGGHAASAVASERLALAAQ